MLIAFLVSWPFPVLAIATIAYLACIPLVWHAFRRLDRAHRAAEAAAAVVRHHDLTALLWAQGYPRRSWVLG